MPAQDRVRADQAVAAQRSGQPPDQCGEHGPVRPVQAWSGVGAAEYSVTPRRSTTSSMSFAWRTRGH